VLFAEGIGLRGQEHQVGIRGGQFGGAHFRIAFGPIRKSVHVPAAAQHVVDEGALARRHPRPAPDQVGHAVAVRVGPQSGEPGRDIGGDGLGLQ